MQERTNPLIGQVVGKYEILSVLGGGGMGTVYRARQPIINRDVAIKIINIDLQGSEQFITRFRREAEAIAALEHPHIIPVIDYGQQGELAYLVMALKTGGNLGHVIRHERLPLSEIARLVTQMAQALDYAHQRGIIHRDLKPANVLLDEDRNTFLTDFGIARRLGETKLTAAGMVVGSPIYMSPEAWRGEDPGPETDVYSLGVIVFEMLTGQPPFMDKAPARLMLKHISDPVPSILALRPDLPPLLETVVNQALAKPRERRFRTAGQMAAMLRGAIKESRRRQSPDPEGEDTTILSSPTAIKRPGTLPEASSAASIPTPTPASAPTVAAGRVPRGRVLVPVIGIAVVILVALILLLLTR